MSATLDERDVSVEYRPMLTPTQAVDLFLGDLSRRSRSKTGRTAQSYGRILDKFTDQLGSDVDVTEITADHCRRFLDRYSRHAPGYQYNIYEILNSYFTWLYLQRRIKQNPLDFIPRPRKIASEDLDVVSVSSRDVPRLLAACETVSETNAFHILAYLGPRRNAVARLRLSDYDRQEGLIRFREKGTKTIWKPVPDELVAVLNRSIDTETLWNDWQPEDPYLVPPEGPLVRADERDDRVIWRLVKNVADGIGIEAHVHALRSAFAVFYLEQGGDLASLQELLGHASPATTKIYLRKLDKRRLMEPVRSLSWAGNGSGPGSPQSAGNVFAVPPVVGAGGFEPPLADTPHGSKGIRQPSLDDALTERLGDVAEREETAC